MKEVKIERTLPVNARINIVSLVNINKYFKSIGYKARSMSQLVNWAIEALEEVVISKVGTKDMVDSLSDALKELKINGLMQRTTETRGRAKISFGLAAENLRAKKNDPQMVMQRRYKEIHGKNRNYEEIDHQLTSNQSPTLEEVRKKIDEVRKRKEEIKKLKEKTLKNALEQGLVTENIVKDKFEDGIKNNVSSVSKVPSVKERFSENDYEEKCQEISRNDKLKLKKENEILSPENLRNFLKE